MHSKLTFNLLACLAMASYPVWIINGRTASSAFFLTSALRSSRHANICGMHKFNSGPSFLKFGSFSASHPKSSARRLGFSTFNASLNISPWTNTVNPHCSTHVVRHDFAAALTCGFESPKFDIIPGPRIGTCCLTLGPIAVAIVWQIFNVVVTKSLLESPSRTFKASGSELIFGFINLASFSMAVTFCKASFLIFQFLSPNSLTSSSVILSLKWNIWWWSYYMYTTVETIYDVSLLYWENVLSLTLTTR